MNYINGIELSKDLYTTLTGNTQLMTKIAGVYDSVPKSPTFPYITISEVIETSDNMLATFGRSTLVNIHTWSTYSGNKETQEIIALIVKALDKVRFSTSNEYIHVSTNYLDYLILKEENDVRHGVVRFRIYTNEK